MIIPSRHGILEIHMEIAHGNVVENKKWQEWASWDSPEWECWAVNWYIYYMFANIYICHNHMKWLSTVNRESALG